MEGEERDVRDSVAPKCGDGAEGKEEGKEPSVSRVRVRATDARNDPRRRRSQLRTNEYETGEVCGGEEEMEMAGAGGEDPITVPAGRDEHRRRRRDGRGGEWRIENGDPDAVLRIAVLAPVRIGGVAEERVGEGEGDEAGRRDAPQALQLRAHRHRALVPGCHSCGVAARHNQHFNSDPFSGVCFPS